MMFSLFYGCEFENGDFVLYTKLGYAREDRACCGHGKAKNRCCRGNCTKFQRHFDKTRGMERVYGG